MAEFNKKFNIKVEVDHQTLVQGALGVFIALLSGSLGYRLGMLSKVGVDFKGALGGHSADSARMKDCSDRAQDNVYPERNLAQESPYSSYRALVEKNHLEEKDRKISSVFMGNEVGHALSHILTFIEFGGTQNSPEGKMVAEDTRFLEESRSDETFAQIQQGIKGLGAEFPSEHQFLIELVGKLVDLPSQQKIDFFIAELTENDSLSDSKQYKLNSVVALSSLMQLDVSSALIEGALHQALIDHSDRSTQLLLLTIYESKYPESGRRLMEEFGL